MTVTWFYDGAAASGASPTPPTPPVRSAPEPSTPAPTAPTTVDYPHIVHSSICSTSVQNGYKPAPQKDTLQPVHIFKLAYALSLAGRFIHDLDRFLGAVRSDSGQPSAQAVYRETCLLLQGFYQVSCSEAPLAQRIDRIWLACRTFFFRGMISTVDGNGLPVGPSAPVRLSLRNDVRNDSEATSEAHSEADPEDGSEDGSENDSEDSSSGPTFSAADIPTLLSTRCNINLPPVESFTSVSGASIYSDLFIWASAGCILGKHCVNVAELPLTTMGLDDMTDTVAQLEARLQYQDQKAIEAAQSDASGKPRPQPDAGHRKRIWCPVMMNGPPDKIIVDLCRRLELKEQQYRTMLHKFCHFEDEERKMEAQARADAASNEPLSSGNDGLE